jgi:hypothetical protein
VPPDWDALATPRRAVSRSNGSPSEDIYTWSVSRNVNCPTTNLTFDGGSPWLRFSLSMTPDTLYVLFD